MARARASRAHAERGPNDGHLPGCISGLGASRREAVRCSCMRAVEPTDWGMALARPDRGDTLEADVEALGVRLSLRWIWRGSDWEFVPPRGYRAGPALLPLTQPVLEYFLAH